MNETPAQLLSALMAPSDVERRPSIRARPRPEAGALLYRREMPRTPTVLKICHAAGVSWRTLNYPFREHFGELPSVTLTRKRGKIIL